MMRARLNEHSQRTGPPSIADWFSCLREKPVGPSEDWTGYLSSQSQMLCRCATLVRQWLTKEMDGQKIDHYMDGLYRNGLLQKWITTKWITTKMYTWEHRWEMRWFIGKQAPSCVKIRRFLISNKMALDRFVCQLDSLLFGNTHIRLFPRLS